MFRLGSVERASTMLQRGTAVPTVGLVILPLKLEAPGPLPVHAALAYQNAPRPRASGSSVVECLIYANESPTQRMNKPLTQLQLCTVSQAAGNSG
jgi:hypothetical protein